MAVVRILAVVLKMPRWMALWGFCEQDARQIHDETMLKEMCEGKGKSHDPAPPIHTSRLMARSRPAEDRSRCREACLTPDRRGLFLRL